MRTVRRNKQALKYSLQTTEKIPVYETDDDGNIVYESYEDEDGNVIYIFDEDGNKKPSKTNEYEYKYTIPEEFSANISMGGSDTQAEIFGIDPSGYDATILVSRNELPLTETSVIWFETEPTYKDDEKTLVDWKSADFLVVKKVDSLSYTTFVLKRRTK